MDKREVKLTKYCSVQSNNRIALKQHLKVWNVKMQQAIHSIIVTQWAINARLIFWHRQIAYKWMWKTHIFNSIRHETVWLVGRLHWTICDNPIKHICQVAQTTSLEKKWYELYCVQSDYHVIKNTTFMNKTWLNTNKWDHMRH